MKNRQEKKLLFNMIGNCFNPIGLFELERMFKKCDLTALDILIADSGLSGFLYAEYSNIKYKDIIPKTVVYGMRQRAGLIKIKNSIISDNLKNIVEALQKKNIKYILLKGLGTLNRIYEDGAMRAISDIDILIKRDDYNSAADALESLEFYYPEEEMLKTSQIYTKKWVETEWNEIKYVKEDKPDDIAVDLHLSLNLFGGSDFMNGLYPAGRYDWFANTKKVVIDEKGINCLNDEYELLFMIYHFAVQHTFMGVKWLVDICLMLNLEGLQGKFEKALMFNANPEIKRIYSIIIGLAGATAGKQYHFHQKSVPMFKRMVFEDITSMKNKVYSKFVKAYLPVSLKSRLKVLRYFMFEKQSIQHRIENGGESKTDILLPFKLLGVLVSDLVKKKSNK